MVTLTKLMHGLLHYESQDTEQGDLRPVAGMTARESKARDIQEAKLILIAQIVGYTGF